MSTRARATGSAVALLIAATSIGGVSAASHREAPLIAGDPSADNTDLYAFVSPDDPDSATIIANYIPLQQPAGGPNFNLFDDAVRYEIHIDNSGDAVDDITYYVNFKTKQRSGKDGVSSFLYNNGPITSLTDENWLVPQDYTVTRVQGGTSTVVGTDLRTVPANIGPRSTPDYASLATAGVHGLVGGGSVYAGPRDDAFFVDLGSIFDVGGLRPFNGFHLIQPPSSAEPGVDGVAGYNTNTIALKVPIADITATGRPIVGIWASASRKATRTISTTGKTKWSGSWVQVSRLANPLVNEVIIPRHLKDYWNGQAPKNDSQFVQYYRTPELAALVNLLYPDLPDTRTTGRDDLVAILLTGLDLSETALAVNYNYTGPVLADMLRLNTGIAPSAAVGEGDRLGVLAGDLAGYPNGRRIEDDVTDIELRAVADGYGPIVNSILGDLTPNLSPNNTVGDGLDANEDMPFVGAFPYVGLPHSGYEAVPPLRDDVL